MEAELARTRCAARFPHEADFAVKFRKSPTNCLLRGANKKRTLRLRNSVTKANSMDDGTDYDGTDYVQMKLVQIDHSRTRAFQEMSASARADGYDFGSVALMSNDNDLLARAFAEEKHRQDLHVVPLFDNLPSVRRVETIESSYMVVVRPAWYMAVVGIGGGKFELALFLVAREPHRYMLLGEVRLGVRLACEIMNDRTGASWNPVPLSGAPE
jgi:hypothetical protein